MIEGCNHQMSALWPMQNEVNVTVQLPVELTWLNWRALEEEKKMLAMLGVGGGQEGTS